MTHHVIRLDAPDDFDGWRDAARALAGSGVPADRVLWQVGDQPADLFATPHRAPVAPISPSAARLNVPRDFIQLARSVVLHRDPERFSLLYALPLRRRVEGLSQAVRRDMHKMRAFVRFREITMPGQDGDAAEGQSRFVAWFEPDHHITRTNAAFFVGRFATMHWSILTPDAAIHWDGTTLRQGPGASAADAAPGDPLEEVWKAYYSAIFNPARLNPRAMLSEMPMKYWKNLPEAALIPDLMATARARELDMIERSRAAQGRHGTAKVGR